MKTLTKRLRLLLDISGSHTIIRRYAVVNGFDGALTMLGMLLGFYVSEDISITTMLNACLGVAVALAVSGISSAYLSESAEQRQHLDSIRDAMVSDMVDSAHSDAARFTPLLVALANGAAPLILSLLIMSPLWLARLDVGMPLPAVEMALATALTLIFLLGLFLGRVRGSSLLISGLMTVLIAAVTVGLILLLETL